jgi:hypothetical protein
MTRREENDETNGENDETTIGATYKENPTTLKFQLLRT